MSPGESTLGTTMASIRPAAASTTSSRSRYPNGVSIPFMRTVSVLFPQSFSSRERITRFRASTLLSKGTLSSRSSMMTSAWLRVAFSCMDSRCPGTESVERRNLISGFFPENDWMQRLGGFLPPATFSIDPVCVTQYESERKNRVKNTHPPSFRKCDRCACLPVQVEWEAPPGPPPLFVS